MARSNPYAGRSHQSTGNMGVTGGLLSVSIETPGLDEAIARLQQFAAIGDTDAKRVRKGMNDTVKLVFGGAQGTVPVDKGDLKGSLFKKMSGLGDGNVEGHVGSGWTMPKALIPFTLEGGRQANRNGRMVIAPRRWLYIAYKRVEGQINGIWEKVLKQITEDLAGKG